MSTFVTILSSAIAIAAIFLYGCTGETIMEKCGHLNLGIPGVMCLGAFGGSYGVSLVMKMYASNPDNASYLLLIIVSILMSMVFSLLGGFIYSILTVTLKCNQNVTGLALTIFGAGFADYFMTLIDTRYFAGASRIIKASLPFASNLGGFGEIFLGQSLLVYIAIIVAIITFLILKKTRIGLNLRAIGENPATADAAGINVTKYKYGSILTGSIIAGLGGLYYIMDHNRGSWNNSATLQTFGWLAIALVIFSVWNPLIAIVGSILFGFLFILPNYINASIFQGKLLDLIPYVVTIVVLIITSVFGKKSVQPPSFLGNSYFREDR